MPWAMRAGWLSLPFTAGAVLADALDPRSTAVQWTAATIAWAAWVVVLIALLIRRPAAVTALRLIAPLTFAACLAAAVDAGRGVVALALTGVPLVLAFLPETGSWLVNGAAYGNERRYPLRAPGAVLAGPLVLTWVMFAGGLTAGPLLLASKQWIIGAIAVIAGAAAVLVAVRAVHALSMRWAVLVPAGLVLKDHVTLTDPVLFQRRDIRQLVPALAGTEALDLTARSPGLAVELRLVEPATLPLVRPGERAPVTVHAHSLIFTPTRPGALLADAGTRHIAVD